MPKKIVLFTPYPPSMGGGAQNLRCALPYLKDVEVTWAYLAQRQVNFPNSICLGPMIMEGPLFKSLVTCAQLSSGPDHPAIQGIISKLLELKADRYWTVAHYEGLPVAEGLIEKGESVHISIHDDPPYTLFGRSRRYFPFVKMCEEQFARVLKGAQSIDVTSRPMGERYKKLYNVASVEYYPYIHHLPYYTPPPGLGAIRVGFAGTIYTPDEPRIFAKALALVSKRMRMPIEWNFWGLGARQEPWVRNLAVPTLSHPFAEDNDFPRLFEQMHFLFVSYPFDKRSEVFRQTSHNAKLSTYLRAQRPIFAHTPLPSSLADFITATNIGIVSDTQDVSALASSIQLLLTTPIPRSNYVAARERWYGEENLERLNKALLT